MQLESHDLNSLRKLDRDIRNIYVNGKTAYMYYEKYMKPLIHRDAITLPSTSPANAAWNMERLKEEWKVIKG